jgi:hyperosmotically inducible periplasmic protein
MKLSILTAVALLAAGAATHTAAAQTATTTEVRKSDAQLSSEIATRIANDKTLSPDAVKVKVQNGVVTLSGVVAKDADKATAEELARVPGVVRVENNLKSRETATDKVEGTAGTVVDKTKAGAKKTAEVTKKGAAKTVDVTKKVAGKTKDVAVGAGENVTDGWITSRIKTRFMGEEVLRASSINVDTNDHVVTLKGAVPTEAARDKALAIAKEVEGVNKVVDSLTVTDKIK